MTVAVDVKTGAVVGQVTTVPARNPDAVVHPHDWLVIVNRFSQYIDVRRTSVRLEEV